MNAPVNDDLRRIGGQVRDAGRLDWEKQFMGALAGSSRPLKRDNPAASDAKLAVSILKTEAARFPWALLFLVCRDGRVVGSTHSEAEAIARVNQMGGAIGLGGFLFLREKFTPFVKPFIAEPGTEDRLLDAVKKSWANAEAVIQDNQGEIEQTITPVSAKVYTDGTNATIFYSWEPPQTPEPGWELVGTIYVTPAPTGKAWVAKARFRSEKWRAVMDQALPLFNKKLKPLIPLLNKLGLSLTSLKPGLAKDLERALQKER